GDVDDAVIELGRHRHRSHSELLADARGNRVPRLRQLRAALTQPLDHSGGRLLGRADVEGRRGIVLDLQLDITRRLLAFENGGKPQGKIDARGDAGAGDDIAVDDHLFADRNGAEQLQV